MPPGTAGRRRLPVSSLFTGINVSLTAAATSYMLIHPTPRQWRTHDSEATAPPQIPGQWSKRVVTRFSRKHDTVMYKAIYQQNMTDFLAMAIFAINCQQNLAKILHRVCLFNLKMHVNTFRPDFVMTAERA